MVKIEVLVISSQYDFSTDIICDRLYNQHVPFLRLNRNDLGRSEWLLTLEPTTPCLRVRGYGEEWIADKDSLRSIWFRQPVFLRNAAESISAQEQLERSQWMGFLRGLSVFDNALWVNHPQATYIAESKPYQLRRASEAGFNVPVTAITNDHASLSNDARFSGSIILKSVDTALFRDDEYNLFPYSSIATLCDWKDDDFVSAPVTCQQLLRPKLDLRVTVVGDTMHCFRIVENGIGIDGDWRLRPKDRLSFEPHQLSLNDQNRCLNLIRSLGLSFAAIDLAETKDGLFFIEVNPTGEWGWLNGPSGEIERSICGLLNGKGL
jgi:hypothetical protein